MSASLFCILGDKLLETHSGLDVLPPAVQAGQPHCPATVALIG